MSSIRRLLYLLICTLLLAGTGSAHELTASLTLDPPVPPPNAEAVLQVRLLGVPPKDRPSITVRASAGAMDERAPALIPLTLDQQEGVWSGRLRFAEAGPALIRLEVTIADGVTLGKLPVRVGPGGFEVRQIEVELAHAGEAGAKESHAGHGQGAQPPPVPAPSAPPAPGAQTPTASPASPTASPTARETGLAWEIPAAVVLLGAGLFVAYRMKR